MSHGRRRRARVRSRRLRIRPEIAGLTTPEAVIGALEGLTAANRRIILRRAKEGRPLRRLYKSGVRYRPEKKEVWKTVDLLQRERHGDCEDLAAARAAELQLAGIPARAVMYQTGPRRWHAIVKHPDGRLEDPSKRLGMRAPRERLGALGINWGVWTRGLSRAYAPVPRAVPQMAPAAWPGFQAAPTYAPAFQPMRRAGTPGSGVGPSSALFQRKWAEAQQRRARRPSNLKYKVTPAPDGTFNALVTLKGGLGMQAQGSSPQSALAGAAGLAQQALDNPVIASLVPGPARAAVGMLVGMAKGDSPRVIARKTRNTVRKVKKTVKAVAKFFGF